MADQWREPLSGRVTARILLQQPIPVFNRVRKLSRSSADSALYRSAERPRIAALTIRVLPHGRPRIAARQPSENRRGVSAEKGKFSVSRTVGNYCKISVYQSIRIANYNSTPKQNTSSRIQHTEPHTVTSRCIN